MRIVSIIARILLGLLFVAAGLLAFFGPPPPAMPGPAGEFLDAYSKSHFGLFVATAQIVAGLLLLANRYVPIALVILAAFIYNSFAFHITMAPTSVFAPIIALILWLPIAIVHRDAFTPLLVSKSVSR